MSIGSNALWVLSKFFKFLMEITFVISSEDNKSALRHNHNDQLYSGSLMNNCSFEIMFQILWIFASYLQEYRKK